MATITNKPEPLSNGQVKTFNGMSRYREGFEFVTRNLIFIGIYFVGYHQFSILWITFPSIFSTITQYWNRKRCSHRQKNQPLQQNGPSETAEWINQFLQQFWPSLDDVAKTWLMKKLQKIGLKILRSDKHRFKISNATWGSISPKISEIRVRDTSGRANENGLMMDFDLTHDSDSNIELSYSSMNIATIIRKFSLKGVIRVVLHPLPTINPLTPFEAIEILFPYEPDVDFELGGLASVLESLGFVDSTRYVSKFLGSIKFILKFTESSSKSQIKPSWELRKKSDITNLGVKDLITQVSNVVQEQSDIQSHTTGGLNLIKRTLNGKLKKHKRKHVPQEDMMAAKSLNEQNDTLSGSLGKIKMGLKYIPDNEELQVIIYEANELHRPPSSDLPNAQIRLLLGRHQSEENVRKTTTQKDTRNPVFSESFQYKNVTTSMLQTTLLDVSVIDRKVIYPKNQSLIGKVLDGTNLRGKSLTDQELFPHIAVEHNPRWKTEIILCGNDLVYSSLPTRIHGLGLAAVSFGCHSTHLLAATTLRNVLGTKHLAEILSERETISHVMEQTLDEATDPWGVKVERVEIKDVRLPVQLQRAMAAEAEAAREARAKVIAAEGEKKASRALRDASEVISESPSALQLRYLQTLNTISAEKNSTIIFPVPMDVISHFLNKKAN